MNAIDLLKQDHNFVEMLFQKIESTPPSRHAATIKKIKDELETHANAEEKIFYPTLKAKGNKELQDITMEGIEEHAQMKKVLREIARSTSSEKREAKLKVLIEDVRHHVSEEEGEMFSLVEDQFSSQELEELGDRIEAEKKRFQKAKGIPARRAEQPKGAVATVLDKAKEFVAAALGGGEQGAQGGQQKSGSARGGAASAKSSGSSSGKSSGSSSRSTAGKSSGSSSGSSSSGKSSGSGRSSGSARSTSSNGSSKSSKSSSASSGSASGRRGTSSKAGSSSSGSGASKAGSSRSGAGSGSRKKSGGASKAGSGSK